VGIGALALQLPLPPLSMYRDYTMKEVRHFFLSSYLIPTPTLP
jgi:hypothetical protein